MSTSLYLIEYREDGRWKICTVSRSLQRARGVMRDIRRETEGKMAARVTRWARPTCRKEARSLTKTRKKAKAK